MRWSRAAYIFPRLVSRGITRMPLNSSTEIRLTRLCTQRCRQCSVYDRATVPPSMPLDLYRHILQDLRSYGAFIGFISGGEPTMHPDLEEILTEAAGTFRISTTLVTGLINSTAAIEKAGNTALQQGINIQTSLDGLGPLGDFLRGVSGFSDQVLKHMALLSRIKKNSSSMLYVNVVINHLNLRQVPEILSRARDLGWKTTVGLYHHLTGTTRKNREMELKHGPELDRLVDFLLQDRELLNLPSWINGIRAFVSGEKPDFCAFCDAPVLATRTTIMEDGTVHLCYGGPVGRMPEDSLNSIFRGTAYRERLKAYRTCLGCWTTCYAQRYLLVRPGSLKELYRNIQKVRNVTPGTALHKRKIQPDTDQMTVKNR